MVTARAARRTRTAYPTFRTNMKFTRDDTSSLTIRGIEAGAIRVGEETLTQSFALTADRIIENWSATDIPSLSPADLESLLAEQPEMIVLGTGSTQQFPPKELIFALARRGIGLETMDTAAACRTFNILVAEGRRPAAVLLVE